MRMFRIEAGISCLLTAMAVAGTVLAQGMPPTLVEVDSVRAMQFHQQITLVGRTEGASTSQIVAEVSGRVARIVAEEGNPIRKGDGLIQLDSDRLKLDLDAKEAEVKEAKELAELWARERKRAEELFARNLIREVSRDSTFAWANIYQARYERLVAERDRLAKDVNDCLVKAPFTGFTSLRLVNVGEWVERGDPVYEMSDISKLRVVVDLPERYFGRIVSGSTVTVYASGDTTRSLSGVVVGTSRSAQSTTHTYPVVITMDNPEGVVGSGALVRVILPLDEQFSGLGVNKDAIVRQGQATMVYTIAEGKAAPIPVTTKAAEGEMVAVEGEGLVAGMVVVVRGNERIFPGSPVRTADQSPAQEGNGAAPESAHSP